MGRAVESGATEKKRRREKERRASASLCSAADCINQSHGRAHIRNWDSRGNPLLASRGAVSVSGRDSVPGECPCSRDAIATTPTAKISFRRDIVVSRLGTSGRPVNWLDDARFATKQPRTPTIAWSPATSASDRVRKRSSRPSGPSDRVPSPSSGRSRRFWARARRIACLEPPTAPLDMKKGGHRASWTTLAAVNEPENMPRAEKPTISMDA